MSDITLELQNETVSLLPEHALFWSRQSTLIVADLHWGKAATFRAAAIPVPGGTTADDLARLSRILDRTQARRLLLLGDLLHAKAGRATAIIDAVTTWRERYADVEIILVRGNHDRHAGDPPDAWRIACVDAPLIEPPFAFRHHPDSTPEHYTLAGHVHPAVVLSGPARQREKLPCFHFGQAVGLLPAFGSFTGTASVRPQVGDQVYVIAGNEIISITG
ncbi:MAG: ligase-associated DNA damage response endonuclease PdeM [Anaerolineae bacterium]|nr:ligase-associated DNA damage response endonuclease PdeM [Anaerolineae bacterium]